MCCWRTCPGTAKTVLARSLAGSIEGATVSRIQCTPDLQPTDITGLSVWNPNTREFEFRPGPIFASILVVDEVNRALPKAQSALLEGMAEHQVTVDGVTHALPDPFFVVATENTIEQEGTFPLPEAQLDRFLIRTSLGYPTLDEELAIVEAQLHGHPLDDLGPVIGVGELNDMFAAVEEIYIDPLLKQWAVELVRATRSDDAIEVGASVRGSLALERMARARALVEGRDYVIAEDIERLFAPVVGHRLILSADALIGSDASESDLLDGILAACLERVPRPEPNWEAGASSGGPVSPAGERPFALVPRRRFVGVRFGQHRSPRRGQGDEVAGTRPYRPGDRPTWIDWPASARLSAARGTDEFVVREFFADTAPLVALVVDRRPRMELYGPPLPWLDKPAATAAAIAVDRPCDCCRRGRARLRRAARRATPLALRRPAADGPRARRGAQRGADASAAGPSLARRLPPRARPARVELPAGTFVFVVSDFIDAVSPGIWLKLRALRWDVTPVVIQDPTWEQSFPDVGGVLLPVRDATSGEVRRGPAQRTRGACPRARQRGSARVRPRRLRPARVRSGRARQQRADGDRRGLRPVGEPSPATAAEERVKRALVAVAALALVAAPSAVAAHADDRRPCRPGDIRASATRSRYVVTATVDGSLVDGARVANDVAPFTRLGPTVGEAIDHGRRWAHHGDGDDRVPLRRLPRGARGSASPFRARASRPAARLPPRPASR